MDLSKLTKNQTSFVFLVIYVATIIVGFVVYKTFFNLTWSPLYAMLIADVAMTIIIFLLGVIFKNASLYDPYWSVIPPFIIIGWNFILGGSFTLPNILVLGVVLLWAIRLTYNWWKNWPGFSKQDWRYDMLKEKNQKIYPITNFFGIHLIPTVVVFIQLINIYYANSLTLNFLFLVGIAICIIAPTVQFIADKQMYDFRKANQSGNKIIDRGLWRYSRHPNYFGELLFWVGIYIIYLSSARKLDLNIVFPILMIMLFIFISVPMMEKKLETREGYNEYKNTVSMIIPLPRKNEN